MLKAAPLKSPPVKKAAPTKLPATATPPKKPAPELKVKGAYPWDAPPQPVPQNPVPQNQQTQQAAAQHQPVVQKAHTAGKRSSHSVPPKTHQQHGMPADVKAHHMPPHPHRAAGLHLYAQTMPGPGLVECNHRLSGGCTPYTNQFGSGWRCMECQTKWFQRANGQQVETSGPSRYRMHGWHPSMPASGLTVRPPPLNEYLTWEQIEAYNQDRVSVNMAAVDVDPGAQDVNGNRRPQAGPQPAA